MLIVGSMLHLDRVDATSNSFANFVWLQDGGVMEATKSNFYRSIGTIEGVGFACM